MSTNRQSKVGAQMQMKGLAEFDPGLRKSFAQSIPNALLISLILLVGAFVILSQQGLHLVVTPPSHSSVAVSSQSSPADEAAVHHTAAKQEQVSDKEEEPVPLLEEPGTGIHSTIRHLQPAGLGSYAFVLTGGYRTHKRGFAVVGLASKPFHVYDKPEFACEWISSESESQNKSSSSTMGRIRKILPDWGYGRVYTVVVIHCTFSKPVGEDRAGGKLVLHVGSVDRRLPMSKVVAFEEAAGAFFDPAKIEPSHHKYDYLYCGSSLFGDINPERMREWIAYHAMLFGERSHFVFHDTGGINSEGMRRVLEPWINLGYVTVQDFTEQAAFDGYYHNQFLVVNDCLFRHKFDAKWMFFFDVDEYVYIPKPGTLESVLDKLGKNHSQIMFEQNLMSHNACLAQSPKVDTSRQWGFEKLVFRNVKTSPRLDRKYVIKPALADSAGVHLSANVRGSSFYSHGQIVYYHFHDTINDNSESCKVFPKAHNNTNTKVWVQKTPYVYDNRLSSMAPAVKEFERTRLGQANAM